MRKGKTTTHTGTRHAIGPLHIKKALNRLKKRHEHTDATDKVFRCADGTSTRELSRISTQYLKLRDMIYNADGKRVLYSLRHTYITTHLKAGDIDLYLLAIQCGTSVEMIERSYSHLKARMHAKRLAGNEKTHVAYQQRAKTQEEKEKKYYCIEARRNTRGLGGETGCDASKEASKEIDC